MPAIVRGPRTGSVVIFLQPLFEEMNRCRRFIADLGAALAARGVGSVLADLPGVGDSVVDGVVDAARWDVLATELVAALDRPAIVVAMRGGCLIGAGSRIAARYHIAPPQNGAALFRDMMRAQAFADMEETGSRREVAAYTDKLDQGVAVRLAGYDVTAGLYRSLAGRAPDASAGVLDYSGPPLWRQADPIRARGEAERLASNIMRQVKA